MKEQVSSRRTKFEIQSRKSIELQHTKTYDANKHIKMHKDKIKSMVLKNHNEEVSLDFFIKKSKERQFQVRFNHNTSLKGVIQRDNKLPPGFRAEDRPPSIQEEDGSKVFQLTQQNENTDITNTRYSKYSRLDKNESNLDIKLGGALKLLEKVFNYPCSDDSSTSQELQSKNLQGNNLYSTKSADAPKRDIKTSHQFIRQQQAVMGQKMLEEYEKDGLYDPIREIWKEKNIGQFFKEKTLQNEKRFEEIENNQNSLKEQWRHKLMVDISKQTQSLNQSKNKSQGLLPEIDFQSMIELKPIFSRYKEMAINRKEGHFDKKRGQSAASKPIFYQQLKQHRLLKEKDVVKKPEIINLFSNPQDKDQSQNFALSNEAILQRLKNLQERDQERGFSKDISNQEGAAMK